MALVSWTNPTYGDTNWDTELNPILTAIKNALNGVPLAPTATKTTAYTAVASDLAMMNVSGGGTALTLPTAPADQTSVGFVALGASTGTPLTISRGGSTDTIGTGGATSYTVPINGATQVLQYNAANTRWLVLNSDNPIAALDARYATTVSPAFTGSPTVNGNALSGTNTGDQTLPVGGTPATTNGTTAAAGSAATFVKTDATLPIFDATVASTLAYGGSATVGTAVVAARRDHVHAMPATTKDTTAVTGLLKGNGTAVSAATAGTDYYNPGGTDVAIVDGGTGVSTLPTGLLKGAGTGAITAAVSGTDYAAATEPLAVKVAGDIGGTAAAPTVTKINGTALSGLPTGLLKNTTTTGVPSIAAAGTDYLAPAGNGSALTGITGSQVSGAALRSPAVTTITVSSNTYTPTASMDVGIVSSPAAAFTMVNPTGSPGDGQRLLIRITSGGTGFAPTWGTAYASSGIATLPTTVLPASKTVTLGFIWDNTAAKWVLLAFDGVGY